MLSINNVIKKALLVTSFTLFANSAQSDILTSIKPLGFIASSIASGVTETQVLLPMGASPHDYSLKPSDLIKLKNADIVVFIGKDIDAFLNKPVSGLEKHKILNISTIEAIEPFLSESDEHEHEHEHEHDDHDINWHIWLSPEISKIIANNIANKLIEQHPNKKEKILQNLTHFTTSVDTQGKKITAQLKPFSTKGYYVFHDAYTYFEDAYGLQQTGYFTINPIIAPGVKTLAKIKQAIAKNQVSCLFAEPQFTPAVITSLNKSTGVHVGTLDPLGESIPLGENAYVNFLQQMADSFSECFKR